MESVKKLKLRELAPFKEGKLCRTPKSYITKYFKLNCPATFFKDGEYQCLGGKNRSFRDLYYLTKAKFPEVTRAEVSYILSKLALSQKIEVLTCPHIGKVVFAALGHEYVAKFPIIDNNIYLEHRSYAGDGYKVFNKDKISVHKVFMMAAKYKEKINK